MCFFKSKRQQSKLSEDEIIRAKGFELLDRINSGQTSLSDTFPNRGDYESPWLFVKDCRAWVVALSRNFDLFGVPKQENDLFVLDESAGYLPEIELVEKRNLSLGPVGWVQLFLNTPFLEDCPTIKILSNLLKNRPNTETIVLHGDVWEWIVALIDPFIDYSDDYDRDISFARTYERMLPGLLRIEYQDWFDLDKFIESLLKYNPFLLEEKANLNLLYRSGMSIATIEQLKNNSLNNR